MRVAKRGGGGEGVGFGEGVVGGFRPLGGSRAGTSPKRMRGRNTQPVIPRTKLGAVYGCEEARIDPAELAPTWASVLCGYSQRLDDIPCGYCITTRHVPDNGGFPKEKYFWKSHPSGSVGRRASIGGAPASARPTPARTGPVCVIPTRAVLDQSV